MQKSKVLLTDRPTDRPTDGAGYRVAWTRLKKRMEGSHWRAKLISFELEISTLTPLLFFPSPLSLDIHSLSHTHAVAISEIVSVLFNAIWPLIPSLISCFLTLFVYLLRPYIWFCAVFTVFSLTVVTTLTFFPSVDTFFCVPFSHPSALNFTISLRSFTTFKAFFNVFFSLYFACPTRRKVKQKTVTTFYSFFSKSPALLVC